MRGIPTAIGGRFRKWQGQYQARCARLDEAMRALETAIREKWHGLQAWRAWPDEQARQLAFQAATAIRDWFQKWWGLYQARGARFRFQRRQPASYSLVAVQRTTAVAKWLAGLSGGATVVAFGFYMQTYLSILSIKHDCVSLRYVADANLGAARFVGAFLVSGMLALLAIAWPHMVGIGRNIRRWRKAHKPPPLQLGHEFDGWSEYQVGKWLAWQNAFVVFSFCIFFFFTLWLVFTPIGSKPEGVLEAWHKFERQCSPQEAD